MTDSLELRLARAGSDLWSLLERIELLPVEAHRPVSSLRRPALVLGAGAIAVTTALTLANTLDRQSSTPAGEIVIRPAEEVLANDVVSLASQHGWELIVQSGSSAADPSGPGRGVDVRLQDSAGGIVTVSLRLDDPAAVAAGTAGRDGLILQDRGTSVYLGTNSDQAVAVELFSSSTILYLRTESTVQRTPEELAQLAVALLAAWQSHGPMNFPPSSTPSMTFITGE